MCLLCHEALRVSLCGISKDGLDPASSIQLTGDILRTAQISTFVLAKLPCMSAKQNTAQATMFVDNIMSDIKLYHVCVNGH